MGQERIYQTLHAAEGKWFSAKELSELLTQNPNTTRVLLLRLLSRKRIINKNTIQEIKYVTHDGDERIVNKKVILWSCPIKN